LTDFLLPPDLRLAKATISLDANTASFSSPTVGSTRTTERLGDHLRINFDFTAHKDDVATARQRGRMQAFLSRLRGQANRVYMSPPGAALRGSFPASELFTSNTFANGTTGWSTGAEYAISATDRVCRAKRIAVTTQTAVLFQNVVLSLGVPYAVRALVLSGRGNGQQFYVTDNANFATPNFLTGYMALCFSAIANASATLGLSDTASSGELAGDYADVPFMSAARCALVDNGPNLLQHSDDINNAYWTPSNATVSGNADVAPDGTSTANYLRDTAVTGTHSVDPTGTISVSSTASDFSFSIALKPGNKTWAYLQIQETTGNTVATAYFNISTGAVGTIQAGANWSNVRAFVVSLGNGWYQCTVIGRKTNAATNILPIIGAATADVTPSYTGVASQVAIIMWRASLAQSSVPTRLVQTTTAAVASTAQTGSALYLKGLPASTNGLLLSGDWIECNGQLNKVVASLDSDAAGLGVVQLARPFRNSPADGAPFIVNNPMGKFMVNSNTTSWNEQPGGLSDATIEFVEDIAF
jgi:hypothetical protein